MYQRIDILKEIMDTEKKFALGEINSTVFEKTMQILEKRLLETSELSDEEFLKAVEEKVIPLSADRLMSKVSIEDLLPTFNVPRTFYRHLKIRREINELEKNIQELRHNIQKLKILIAEKKVNIEAAAVKVETLEFDLRLAENRLAAREKYLKRNPTKGELLKFTLENYLKFSFGHGVSNEYELKQLAKDLENEINLREEYRKAIAEMYASVKTTQLDISTKAQSNGLPDFKVLIEYQDAVNELKDYIGYLTSDITNYSNCLSLLQKDILEMDDKHGLFLSEDFGIKSIVKTGAPEVADDDSDNLDPLLQSLEQERNVSDHIAKFLIDTTETMIEETTEFEDETEIMDTLCIPEAPQPTYKPEVDIEIIGGMEDFNSQFKVKEKSSKMSKATKNIIFQSFEGLLEKLLDEDIPKPIPEPSEAKQPIKKVELKPLMEDIQEIKQSDDIAPVIEVDSSIETQTDESLDDLTEDLVISDEILIIDDEESESITQSTDRTSDLESQIPSIPTAPTDISEQPTKPIEELTAEIVKDDTEAQVPKPPMDDLQKPKKSAMITKELSEAALDAWKLSGKAIFSSEDDKRRKFLGYIQEVIVFDKTKLGFILVSEPEANQAIIDRIFDQIKPLWVTEDLLDSATKRKEYVINEVIESLQVQRDVTLHITKLQEFANYRNINYPKDIETPKQKPIGIVPIDKIRIKRGTIVCAESEVIELRPYRTAPWIQEFEHAFENNPIGTICYYSKGQKIGKVIATLKHPLLGNLLLVDKEVPNDTLIDYFVQRLEITERDSQERLWLVKYLISKQLRIPEGEALKPRTLINYSLMRGFPILPNEVLNSYRVFVSGGSIGKITKKNVILKDSSRTFQSSEVYPLECLRVRQMTGHHLGTCLGVSLSDHPVLLVSERLSREIVLLFTDATVEKEVMNDISKSVMGTIGVEFKDSLCLHNILKTLIVGKKIQNLQEYGKYLTKLNVNGLLLSDIQIVEKGTIYLKSEKQNKNSIFDQ